MDRFRGRREVSLDRSEMTDDEIERRIMEAFDKRDAVDKEIELLEAEVRRRMGIIDFPLPEVFEDDDPVGY